MEQLRHQ